MQLRTFFPELSQATKSKYTCTLFITGHKLHIDMFPIIMKMVFIVIENIWLSYRNDYIEFIYLLSKAAAPTYKPLSFPKFVST